MLSYAFDIYKASRANAGREKTVSGLSPDDDQDGDIQDGDVIAVFRDQQTADAVTSAPAVVRLFLEETGFGFSVPTGTAPVGYVRANNAVAQRNLKKRIARALSNSALERALNRASNHSSFDVREFILSVVRARQSMQPQQTDTGRPTVAAPAEKPIQTPSSPVARVTPRRPSDLHGRGIKSRLRPQQI